MCENTIQNVPVILQDSIEIVIKNEKFLYKVIDFKRVSANEGSYMGDLYAITLKDDKVNNSENINLFAKIDTSCDEEHGVVVSIKELYKSEIFVYTELNDVITRIQSEVYLPISVKYKMVPFYNAGNTRIVIMDDMTKKGYKVFDRLKVVSLQFAEFALREIAKFHAMTFVIEKTDPQFHKNKIKTRRLACHLNEDYEIFLKTVFDSAIDVLESEESKKRLIKFSKGVIEKVKILAEDTNGKVQTLCHGDFRVNNILIRESDGNISDMVILDYQHLSYGQPVQDIFYLIFGATDQGFREKHLLHLRDHYYTCFKDFLRYFGINSEDVYPREQFEKDFQERLDYGLVVVIQTLPFILASEDNAPDMKIDGLSGIKIAKHNQIYKERVNDLVNEGIKWGIL